MDWSWTPDDNYNVLIAVPLNAFAGTAGTVRRPPIWLD
jgi:hypothetical protein